MTITLPEQGLVLLMGASGSGKSTFAAQHFLPTEVVSSDHCRALVSDDENDQNSTAIAFELLHSIVGLRLRNRRFTVVDATNLRSEDRMSIKRVAREHDALCSVIVFETPKAVCIERNQAREDRNMASRVIARHCTMLKQSARALKKERYHRVYRVGKEADVEVEIVRSKLWNNKRDETGPFDIIGDLHGCATELEELLQKLGYTKNGHPEGRKAFFVGDITDRGPRNLDCYEIVRRMVEADQALCIAGNHDAKLLKYLKGKKVTIAHGMQTTVTELEAKDDEYKREMYKFLNTLISHYVLDGGRLVVAHAGLKEDYHGKASGRVREFCLYGDTTGESDEFGLPVRLDWAKDYRGEATVVYGHTPVPKPVWLNRTINIDTGCVFGGGLTSLRYPEMELVTVPCKEMYWEPKKPLQPERDDRDPNEIKLSDVIGKQILSTRLRPQIGIPAEQSAAALEVITRFAIAPEWLIYLPPTMSPCETSDKEGYLEYPSEAFKFYKTRGQKKVICEEKHMGSRAVLYLKKNGEGRVFTRTGRPFFPKEMETTYVGQLTATLSANSFWEELETDWVCIDAELMPWSAKAKALLQSQYAAVGASSVAALTATVECLEGGPEGTSEFLKRAQQRLENAKLFGEAYAQYCWPTEGLEGVKLAPFHLLATEGKVYSEETHRWHLDTLKTYLGSDSSYFPTKTLEVELDVEESVAAGCRWWEELTATGGEGMVVKPETFLAFGKKGLLQPAVKVRGREYLRIIYGADYTEHLPQLRKRGLGRKRSLALREFCLGLEALEKFAQGGPLYEVHRCVFGVLALESSPVDPRL